MTEHHWSHSFETGHEDIDHHHQELFSLVTMIDSAISSGKKSDIESIIQFLEHYVEDHFDEEETLMLAHDYLGYDVHKHDHEIFKARVFSVRNDFDSGMSEMRIIFALRMFLDKLVHHIQTIDIGIADITKEGKP